MQLSNIFIPISSFLLETVCMCEGGVVVWVLCLSMNIPIFQLVVQTLALLAVTVRPAVTSDTFLAPLNKENIGLTDVVFLPDRARRSRQIQPAQYHQQIQYSDQGDQIRSREDMQGSDIIDPVYSNSYQDEDYNHHVMTGSYAYVRNVCCFNSINLNQLHTTALKLLLAIFCANS